MARKPKEENSQEPVSVGMEIILPQHPLQEVINKRIRDSRTGLLPNLDYKFNDDGTVNWEEMIPAKFFYPRKEMFPEGTDFKSLNVEELSPDKRILNLDGIKWLLNARGAKSIEFVIGSAYPEYAACTCKVTWVKNYESEGEIVTSGNGEAHSFNNNPPFKYLLATLAENKALSRAVRLACNIKTYSSDELRGEPGEKPEKEVEESAKETQSGFSPQNQLADKLKKYKIPFEKMKKGAILHAQNDEQKARIEKAESVFDLESIDCFFIIQKIIEKYGE